MAQKREAQGSNKVTRSGKPDCRFVENRGKPECQHTKRGEVEQRTHGQKNK